MNIPIIVPKTTNEDLLASEEKRKRGRPKKVMTEVPVKESDIGLKRKRGRRKKPELSAFPTQITVTNNRNDSNYLVMLDIKFSDLYSECPQQKKIETATQQSGGLGRISQINNVDHSIVMGRSSQGNTSHRSNEACERLICDSLINSFSRLINDKKQLYENCPTLKTIHKNMITPETSSINFYSNYEQHQFNTKVLPIFELNGNSWPHYSNYACWNCDCQFESAPIGIPEKVSNNQFYCSGNFCSFPCAARFIIDNDNSINRFEKISFLNTLYQKAFNLDLDAYITVANPKQTLHKYGGSLSYSQYHGEKAKEVSLYKLPIVPLFYYLCHENLNNADTHTDYTREIVTY